MIEVPVVPNRWLLYVHSRMSPPSAIAVCLFTVFSSARVCAFARADNYYVNTRNNTYIRIWFHTWLINASIMTRTVEVWQENRGCIAVASFRTPTFVIDGGQTKRRAPSSIRQQPAVPMTMQPDILSEVHAHRNAHVRRNCLTARNNSAARQTTSSVKQTHTHTST